MRSAGKGFGTLVAKLADGLPVQLSTQVKTIHWGGRTNLDVETTRGLDQPAERRHRHGVDRRARSATRSSSIRRCRSAISMPSRKLTLGSYDHIALELEGNPLGLQNDDLVFEKASSNRTAALLANVVGHARCAWSRSPASSARASRRRAKPRWWRSRVDWLADLYGSDIKKAVKRKHATNWAKEPWALGAFSAASVGGQPARRVLMEPHRQPHLFRRRGGARDAVGHGRRRLGIGRARRRRDPQALCAGAG